MNGVFSKLENIEKRMIELAKQDAQKQGSNFDNRDYTAEGQAEEKARHNFCV